MPARPSFGLKDFGSYMTDNVMAKNVSAAEDLLMKIWRPAVKRVGEEVAEMQALADKRKDGITIEPWDYYYYAEKVRGTSISSTEGSAPLLRRRLGATALHHGREALRREVHRNARRAEIRPLGYGIRRDRRRHGRTCGSVHDRLFLASQQAPGRVDEPSSRARGRRPTDIVAPDNI